MGRVTVRVTRIGQQIAFRVEDDGRGLDIAAIRAAAVARGLTPTTPTVIGIAEAAQILFRGGVSTSPSVSEFSGRGVGLDIVRAAAQRLKGTAALHSDPGQGTTVEISVPLSIESISALAVAVGDVTVLIPAGAVCRAARVCSGDLVDFPSGASLLVAEQAIPFRPLSDILDLKNQIDSTARPRSVVVVQADGIQVAIGVDRLKEIRNVVVRPLPAACCAVSLVAGATLNGMGNPELVLDPGRLVAAALANPGPRTQTTPVAQQTVLVVDDSLTTRMLEQSILEAAGFCVDLATSGEEALIKARNQSHSLFIVDVEMPGMNGFELLHRFREDPALQGTPAIMVSSRNSADDRRCADQAGARDYIVKSEFDESRLLRTIRGLLTEVSQ
jgi:two-component system chemotaxis sensor kinase CheA